MSGDRKDGGPAFPRRLPDVSVPPDEALRIIQQHEGMSLLDYFAAAVVKSGLLPQAIAETPRPIDRTLGEHIALISYAIAARMLAARAKK